MSAGAGVRVTELLQFGKFIDVGIQVLGDIANNKKLKYYTHTHTRN